MFEKIHPDDPALLITSLQTYKYGLGQTDIAARENSKFKKANVLIYL